MKRFASLATTAALAGALVGVGSVSHAQNVLNMYLVPVSPTSASYAPGDTITFMALTDIPVNSTQPITLTLGASVAYNSAVFDINGVNATADTSAYPPKPAVHTWDLVAPLAYSNTATGPSGPLDTLQLGVGHTKQITQPGSKTTSIPGGTYTIGTFSFPVIAPINAGSPTTIYLPTAFGFGGPNAAADFINSTDSTGTNHATLAFPNGNGKFSSLTYGTPVGPTTPAPSSLLVVAMGAVPAAGMLRRRRAAKK